MIRKVTDWKLRFYNEDHLKALYTMMRLRNCGYCGKFDHTIKDCPELKGFWRKDGDS